MRILVVSQCFYPEEFKVNDLVAGMVARGHDVTVLTGKPNYPKGEYFDGYRFWGVQKEHYKGAEVIRVPLIKRGKSGTWRLILNYLSFVLFGCLYAMGHKAKYDKVFCFGVSPITQIYPALIVKRKLSVPVCLWYQDLWPESVAAASKLNSPLLMKILNILVKRIYKATDKILIQSPAFKESILQRGDYESKLSFAPNWAEDIFIRDNSADKEKYKALIPNGFIVMFAGNIGEAQDFESIIRAAECCRNNPAIKWVIVGDGRKRADAELLVQEKNLTDKIIFLGRYPVTEMPHFFVHANAMLVSLKKEYIFSLTIPSKTQAYMAFGKPILSMMDGIGNTVINQAECGYTCTAGDYRKLAENVELMARISPEKLLKMGKNGQIYYKRNYDKDTIIDDIIRKI